MVASHMKLSRAFKFQCLLTLFRALQFPTPSYLTLLLLPLPISFSVSLPLKNPFPINSFHRLDFIHLPGGRGDFETI